MNRIKEIVARLQAIDHEQAAIDAEAEKAGGVMTDEQRQKYAALDTEAEALVAEKKTLEADEKRKAARAERREHLTVPTITRPRVLGPDSAEPLPEEAADTRRPGRLGAIPSWVRPATAQHFRGERDGRSAEERAFRFGMWGRHTMARFFPHLRSTRVEDFVKKELAAHGENDAFGSDVLVPEEFAQDLVDLRLRYGVARTLFRVRRMTRDTLLIPARGDRLEASFVGENQPIPEDNISFVDRRLVAKKLGVISRWSNELDEDAMIDFGDELARDIAWAFAKKEDQCCFLGDGSSTYGGIVGIIPALQDVDGSGTDSVGVVAQGTGNTLAAMTLNDFVGVPAALPDFAGSDDLRWVMNRTTYYSTVMKLVLAAGGATPADALNGQGAPTLLGYPVTFSNVLPSATATNTIFALFGNFRLAGTFGDRRQETLSFSEHATVNGESVWQRDQMAIRGTERFDFLAHDLGTSSEYGAVVALRTGS